MDKILPAFFMVLIGFAFQYLYVYVARNRYRAKMNIVTAVMYSVDTAGFPFSERLLEFVLRGFKFVGLMLVIIGVATPFME